MTTYQALEKTIATCANDQDTHAAVKATHRAHLDGRISRTERNALLQARMSVAGVLEFFEGRGMGASRDAFQHFAQAMSADGVMVPCELVERFCDALSPLLYRELECEVITHTNI